MNIAKPECPPQAASTGLAAALCRGACFITLSKWQSLYHGSSQAANPFDQAGYRAVLGHNACVSNGVASGLTYRDWPMQRIHHEAQMPPPSVFEDTGPPPPLWRGASTLAAMTNADQPLHGGGSFSLAAPHYCPICGIIATSEANLQVAHRPVSGILAAWHPIAVCRHTVLPRQTDADRLYHGPVSGPPALGPPVSWLQLCSGSQDGADQCIDSDLAKVASHLLRGSILCPAYVHKGAKALHLAGPLAGQAPCQEAAVPAPHASGRASQAHRPHHLRQGHATHKTASDQTSPAPWLEQYDSQMSLSPQQACMLLTEHA